MIFSDIKFKIHKSYVDKKIKKRKLYDIIPNLLSGYNTYVTFSQNCEDLIIQQLLSKEKGIYVDIGAHHPVRLSNTCLLYQKGWNGINIDPLPGCIEVFDEYRPDDINLNIGIAGEKGKMVYYDFTEPAYNTFGEERANYIIEKAYTKLKQKIEVPVETLTNVLTQYENVFSSSGIDLMNIDVETMEMEVLRSNDWTRFRPKLIVMESIQEYGDSVDKLMNDKAISYMVELGYCVIAKALNAVFLMDTKIMTI